MRDTGAQKNGLARTWLIGDWSNFPRGPRRHSLRAQLRLITPFYRIRGLCQIHTAKSFLIISDKMANLHNFSCNALPVSTLSIVAHNTNTGTKK